MNQQHPSALYSGIASEYDYRVHDVLHLSSHQRVFERVKELCPNVSGRSLLDLGIGTGYTTQPFADAGADCHGIDASKSMLAECEKKNIANSILHDLTDVPYPSSKEVFDIIISEGVLYHVKELQDVFHETYRLLAPNGTLQLSFETLQDTPEKEVMQHKGNYINGVHFQHGLIAYLHPREEVISMLQEAGFTDVNVDTFVAAAIRDPSAAQETPVIHTSFLCHKKHN